MRCMRARNLVEGGAIHSFVPAVALSDDILI
jgi:hypothetical protein